MYRTINHNFSIDLKNSKHKIYKTSCQKCCYLGILQLYVYKTFTQDKMSYDGECESNFAPTQGKGKLNHLCHHETVSI